MSRTHDSRLLAELQLNAQTRTSYHNNLTKVKHENKRPAKENSRRVRRNDADIYP